MKNYLVITNSSTDYVVDAECFQIFEGIIHFYDADGEPICVFKEWTAFRRVDDTEVKATSPDEFYEKLKEESQ